MLNAFLTSSDREHLDLISFLSCAKSSPELCSLMLHYDPAQMPPAYPFKYFITLFLSCIRNIVRSLFQLLTTYLIQFFVQHFDNNEEVYRTISNHMVQYARIKGIQNVLYYYKIELTAVDKSPLWSTLKSWLMGR